ncbi:s00954 pol polyprotein transposon 1731 [Lasius niger]|uniref:S00954 pol polyprotein transposon 1731 n=1 Tax=Lasius niger TaxID=67767 RepID=A0A0J7KAI2_LASNI|nr:s00954 pol polyprotein transposon 1731 [Lasius niger]
MTSVISTRTRSDLLSLSFGGIAITWGVDLVEFILLHTPSDRIGESDAAFDAFKEFKAYIETQTGRRIKSIQTDNYTAYQNDKFDNFLKINGIKHRLTVTHTPEQNGVTERRNRNNDCEDFMDDNPNTPKSSEITIPLGSTEDNDTPDDLPDPDSENNYPVDTNKSGKNRGRGRPRKILTGEDLRSIIIPHNTNDITATANMAEVPLVEVVQGPDADQ